MDFFAPTDRRYEYRMNEERKKTAARRSPQSGCNLYDFGFALFEAFDTPVSAASQNTNQFSKSSQSMFKFSAVQSILFSEYQEIFYEITGRSSGGGK